MKSNRCMKINRNPAIEISIFISFLIMQIVSIVFRNNDLSILSYISGQISLTFLALLSITLFVKHVMLRTK